MRTTLLPSLLLLGACPGGTVDLPGKDDSQTGPADDSGIGYDDGTSTCTGSDLVPLAVIRTDDGDICTDCDRHNGINLWAGIRNDCEEQVGIGLDYACLVVNWTIVNSAGEETMNADSGCAEGYHLLYVESGDTRYDQYYGTVALTEDDAYTLTANMGTVDDLQATAEFTVY